MIIVANLSNHSELKKSAWMKKIIESFSDVEVKSLVRSDLFLFRSFHIYNFNFTLFVLEYLC